MPATRAFLLCRLVLFAPLAAGLVGCESLPPAAAGHAALTRQYHEAVTAATLAAFDAVGHALFTSLDASRQAAAEDWAASIALARDAAAECRRAGNEAAATRFDQWAATASDTAARDARALADRAASARGAVALLRADIAQHAGFAAAQLAVIDASLSAHAGVAAARDQALGLDLAGRLGAVRSRVNDTAARAGAAAGHIDQAIRDLMKQ